jgi:hypothetical protein
VVDHIFHLAGISRSAPQSLEQRGLMSEDIELERGTQIAYIPDHAEHDIRHPDVEFGFVTSVRPGVAAYCRYWVRGKPGVLRTVANSELTDLRHLVLAHSVEQVVVEQALREIERGA